MVKAYWLYGHLTSIIVSILISIIVESLLPFIDMNTALSILIVLFITSVCYMVIAFAGIWRAANKYEGRRLWAFLAKASVVLWILVNITVSVSVFDSVKRIVAPQGLVDSKEIEIQYTRYEGWQDVDIPGRFSFQIPPTMEFQDEFNKEIQDLLIPKDSPFGRLSDAIIVQQKGLNDREPKAFDTFARIIIYPDAPSEVPEFKLGSNLRAFFTQRDLNDLSDILRKGYEVHASQNPLGSAVKLVSWNGTSIIDVNNYTCLLTTFARTVNNNPPTKVYSYIIYNGKKVHTMTASYRLTDSDKWENDLIKVINTFNFYKD